MNWFGIQIMWICLLIDWFTIQMPGTMEVGCSDHHLLMNQYKGMLDPIIIKLITYYLPVCYLLRIQQYTVNTTYNSILPLFQ